MAVLKQSSPRAAVATGGVFDLADLRAGAERALAEARAEAARIVDEARREGERIRAAAQRDGFAKGEAEGFAKGDAAGRAQGAAEGLAAAKAEHDARLSAIEEAFAGEFARWMSVRDESMRFAEKELAGIAVSMAESIVREHIDADRDAVVRQAQHAVQLFARATRVTIEVSPDDAPLVAESMPRLSAALPEGAAVSIVAREGIARGGCTIRSSEGTVDARIETQFRRLREGLLGAPDASEPDASEPDASEPDASEPDAFGSGAPGTDDAEAGDAEGGDA